MADLPVASLTIDDESGSFGAGTDYLVVMGCCPSFADGVPRVFASTKALLAKHGYSQAADYCAMHFQEPSLPVIFIGLPAVTAGYVGSVDHSQVDGTAVIRVTAGAGGVFEEVDGSFVVVNGGTVGTDQISGDLSLDGGRTTKRIRLGTASSYTIPYIGLVLSFSGGTLLADDIVTFRAFPARPDQAGKQAAREALATQAKPARSWLLVDDCKVEADAQHLLTEVDAYASTNDRYVYARAQVRDRRAAPKMTRTRAKMAAGASLTFAEVGATGDTITRATGSWITDGFAVGDLVTVTGSASNNITAAPIVTLTATVITFGSTALAAEVTTAATVYATPAVTFAEVGLTGDTITRSSGSWIADGFKVGDLVTITGAVNAENNVVSAPIATLTATVMTLDDDDLEPEVIGAYSISVTAPAELNVDALAANDAEFADIDDDLRLDLGYGRGAKVSPITGWELRRPVQWAASLREFQHDVQIPCWRKTDGRCDGFDLEDEDGVTVEHDERTDGGALLARFTCFRTYSNGPSGAYIALSLTRASEGSLLSRTHNVAVANVFSTVVQAETENFIGQVLELKADGTATEASLVELETRVNSALAIALLQRKSEGPRASSATWSASRTDVLNVPGAELTGEGALGLNGTIEKIRTTVRVDTAG